MVYACYTVGVDIIENEETVKTEPTIVEVIPTQLEQDLSTLVEIMQAEQEEKILQAEEQLEVEEGQVSFEEQVLQLMATPQVEGIDYTGILNGISSQLSSMETKITTLEEQGEQSLLGTDTIYTYGIIYVPFAIVLFLLYRFFWTFLRQIK